MQKLIATALALILAAPALAEGENVTIAPPAEGSVSEAEGLAAWARIY